MGVPGRVPVYSVLPVQSNRVNRRESIPAPAVAGEVNPRSVGRIGGHVVVGTAAGQYLVMAGAERVLTNVPVSRCICRERECRAIRGVDRVAVVAGSLEQG